MHFENIVYHTTYLKSEQCYLNTKEGFSSHFIFKLMQETQDWDKYAGRKMLAFPFLLCSQSFFPKNLSGCNHCHSTRVINVSFPPLGHGHSRLILVFPNNDTDACQIYNVRASHKHGTLRVFINSIFFNSRIKTIHTTLAHVHRSHTWIHGKPWESKYRANPSRQG